jgi:alkylation response protein AidB-like acyl-CoA dehydrogenase
MRWLGMARRAHDIALDRANEREAFGSRLGELGMVQAMIADNEIDLDASRGLIWAVRLRAGPGRQGRARVLDRQGVRRRGRLPHRRPLAADLRQPRGLRRRAAGAPSRGDPAVPDLRRADRDPQVVDRPSRPSRPLEDDIPDDRAATQSRY